MEQSFVNTLSSLGLIRIKLMIAGKYYYFLVDTGSSDNYITAEAAEELEGRYYYVTDSITMGGITSKEVKNAVVNMGFRFNHQYYRQNFTVVDSFPAFDIIERQHGVHFDGILGTIFLYGTKATIDFADLKIRWDNDRERKKLPGIPWYVR